MTAPDPYLIQTLFGDIRFEQLVIDATESEPWYSFGKARAEKVRGDSASAVQTLSAVATALDIDARYRALAWNLVRQLGGKPPDDALREVLGVVVEVGMQEGFDLLATYTDRTAYYYNYSGAAVIWMRPDSSLDQTIAKVIEAARPIAKHIGPWDKERRPPPGKDVARLNVLTPAGLHFGEAPIQLMSRDPVAAPLLTAATTLLTALTSLPRSTPSQHG